MFRATVSPIFRRTLTVYTAFWNNVPTVLSAADRGHIGWNWSIQVPSNLFHRSAADSRVGTLFQKAVYTVKVLLKMGETVARNMYSKLKKINKTNFAASCWLLISLY